MLRARMVLLLTLFAPAMPGAAQVSMELTGVAGFTAMEVEAWHQSPVNDWEQFMSGFAVRILPLEVAGLGVGLEGGYRYLAWYNYLFTGSTIEVDVEAYPIMGLVRVPLGAYFASELRGGAYVFDGFTDPAVGAALLGRIPITKAWHVPVRLHADIVFDSDTNLVPIGAELGIGYDFH